MYIRLGGMLRVSKLVDDIIRADANYFNGEGFILISERDRVYNWLEGGDDMEIQLKVAGWLESDAKYFRELAQALVNYHWFILPFMSVFTSVVPGRLQKYADKLREM